MKILSFIFILLLSATPVYAWQSWNAKVINIADGDTITVLDSNKRQTKVRLYGVDCPEKRQAFGNRARQATERYAKGQSVQIQTMDTDRYGRTVGVVYFSNGHSLNEMLVDEGLAWVYTKYCTERFICDPLREAEASARAGKRGLWVEKHPVEPWVWRKQSRSRR